MKIKDIMTSEPLSCPPDTTAAQAASLMWDGGCGILPVVEDGKLAREIIETLQAIGGGHHPAPHVVAV